MAPEPKIMDKAGQQKKAVQIVKAFLKIEKNVFVAYV